MSPLLKKVEKQGIAGILAKRNPAKVSIDDFFGNTELIRSEFARLINGEPNRVVLVPSVSYGMANVMKNV